MTVTRIVPCAAPGCHSLVFGVRHDPRAGEIRIVCERCDAVFAVLETDDGERRGGYVMAPGGLGP